MSIQTNQARNSAALNRKLFIEEAEKYVGYVAPANQQDMFTQALGVQGGMWNGAFVDYIFLKTGIQARSHLLTNVALSSSFKEGRIHVRPQVGDIVFMESSTDPETGPFNQPHIGIVTDVSHYSKHGMFQCIEAQTSAGLPKGTDLRNGVYRRNRYEYDVLAFARPNFKRTKQEAQLPVPGKLLTKPVATVNPSIIRPGLKHPQVTTIQIALATFNGLKGVPRGEFDHKTRSAYANFQRSLGYIGSAADGVPDANSLKLLGEITGMFVTG
jgi:hypothetical protein